jgi:hypothetical protein
VRTYTLYIIGIPLLLIVLFTISPWSLGGGSGGSAYGDPYGDDYGALDTTSSTSYTPPPYTPSADTASPDAASPTDTFSDSAGPSDDTPSTPDSGDPASVVTNYFDAINNQDYQSAWNLGGSNLDSSYSEFVSGFDGTQQDTVTILSVQGDIVSVDLSSVQTDGGTTTYSGTYTVVDGAITASHITQTS